MLKTHALAEGGIIKFCHVTGCVNVGVTGEQIFVHADPVPHLQPGRFRQLDVQFDPDPGDDTIGNQLHVH